MSSRAVEIIDYQAAWAAEFAVIAEDLRTTLGDKALQIDHIGSTAVPGLCAKDILDVQLTVRLLDDNIAQSLLQAGFTTHADPWRLDHVPPGLDGRVEDWRKLFFMQRPGARRSNIHVRQLGRPNQRYALLVRDFLRADERTAQAYGRLKQRLASALADPQSYPDVKDPVADLIYFAAEAWANSVLLQGAAP
jgi:GrpB-like predicted nucleotidyltransferase (UPF0157 family)